jgi:hypothetical protein
VKLPRDLSGAILGEVATHLKLTREELLARLFD